MLLLILIPLHFFTGLISLMINTFSKIFPPQKMSYAFSQPLFGRWIGHMLFLQKLFLSFCWAYVYKPYSLESRHFFLSVLPVGDRF